MFCGASQLWALIYFEFLATLITENALVKSRDMLSGAGCVSLRPRLHGIRSKWNRIHLDLIHFLRCVYTGSDPELLAFTRDRIHVDFMNS